MNQRFVLVIIWKASNGRKPKKSQIKKLKIGNGPLLGNKATKDPKLNLRI